MFLNRNNYTAARTALSAHLACSSAGAKLRLLAVRFGDDFQSRFTSVVDILPSGANHLPWVVCPLSGKLPRNPHL